MIPVITRCEAGRGQELSINRAHSKFGELGSVGGSDVRTDPAFNLVIANTILYSVFIFKQ